MPLEISLEFLLTLTHFLDHNCLSTDTVFALAHHPKMYTVNVLNFKMSDKMSHANSADPDQTAPSGAF